MKRKIATLLVSVLVATSVPWPGDGTHFRQINTLAQETQIASPSDVMKVEENTQDEKANDSINEVLEEKLDGSVVETGEMRNTEEIDDIIETEEIEETEISSETEEENLAPEEISSVEGSDKNPGNLLEERLATDSNVQEGIQEEKAVDFDENGFSVNENDEISYEPAIYNNGVYEISNAGQLYWYAGIVNGDSSVCKDGIEQRNDARGKLTSNIDLSCSTEIIWKPIGEDEQGFDGVFEGNGYTIYDLYINNEKDNQGLFGKVNAGHGLAISDLNIENAFIHGANYVGALAGLVDYGGGAISNINIVGSQITGKSSVGGCIGQSYSGNNIVVIDSEVKGEYYVGGIIGSYYFLDDLYDCINYSTVEGGYAIGGIVGMIDFCNPTANKRIMNCYNQGDIIGDDSGIGGIIGSYYIPNYVDTNGDILITGCFNSGNIYGNHNIGGIIGTATISTRYSTTKCENCYNRGCIKGEENVGGIVGSAEYALPTKYCYNAGILECPGYYHQIVNKGGSAASYSYHYIKCGEEQPNSKPLSYEQMQQESSFQGWDFDEIWSIDSDHNGGFPYLKWSQDIVGNDSFENGDITETKDNSNVHLFKNWDSKNKTASFFPSWESVATEKTDMSFLDNLDSLLNSYVLVTTEPAPGGLLQDNLVSIQPVETQRGTVSEMTDKYVVIDGVTYQFMEDFDVGLSYTGDVVYHLIDDRICGISALTWSDSGRLGEWVDANTFEFHINLNSDTYMLSPLTATQIKEKLALYDDTAGIKLLVDNLNIVYDVEIIEGEDASAGFNRYVYQADILNDLSIPNSATVAEYLKQDTVSKLYLEDLQNRGFDWATDLWEACDLISSSLDDPTKLVEFVVEPKDIYMAIIMNALETSADMDSVVDSEYQKLIKSQKKFVSTIKDTMQELYNIDILNEYDYQSLTYEQQKMLSDLTEKFFKYDFADLDNINQVLSGVSTGIDTVSNIEDFYERCVSITMAANLSQSIKEVVREAYEQSKDMDPYLRAAFKECVEIIDSSQTEIIQKMIEGEGTAIGWSSFKYLYKEMFWKDVSTKIQVACPEVALLQTAYKSGKYVADLAFNTSQITEQYGKMMATYQVEQAFNKAYDSLQQKFLDSGSVNDAINYLSALELAYKMIDLDCAEAWNFVDAVDHDGAWINGLLGHADDIKKAKEAIEALQRLYSSTYESSQTIWINYLPEDYPGSDLYEIYEPLLDESDNRILAQKWVAACPVDVYVYDSEDHLVASVVDNRVFCGGDLTVALDGDVKTLCFYEDTDDYYIRYVGNDSGNMDVTVKEYQNGVVEKTVNFYDIPLSDGTAYEAEAMTSECVLKEENGNEMSPDYNSSEADKTAYSVSIQSGTMLQAGEPFLTTTARAGETMDIQAYIPTDGTFIRWEASNGEDIFEDSLNPITTFRMPEEDIIIHAVTSQSQQILCSIIFDTQGGNEMETIYVPFNAEAGELGVPYRAGYKFVGWYTEPEGQGEQITADTLVSGDLILYAFWKHEESEPEVPDKATDIFLQKPVQSIYEGDKVPLTVTIYPENAADKTIVWSTSDSSIATVSDAGVLTALREGKVTVSVSLPDGSLKKSIVLEILKKKETSDHSHSSSGSSGHSGSGGSSHSDGGSSFSSSGSSSANGPGAETGIVTTDPKKGQVNSLTGIITGTEPGFSRWIQDEQGWKLLYADNTYASGIILQGADGQPYEQIAWELVNGSWFAFGADGYLKTGFIYDHQLSGWFYVDVNAGMFTDWQFIDSAWYYFNPISDGTRGKMAADTWVNQYYVNKNGVWEPEKVK